MPVKLRLQRHGAKKRPFYRIVAADVRAPRDGRFLDIVGTYNPLRDPVELRLKIDRVDYWLGNGAQMTDTVANLVRKARRNPEILVSFEPPRRVKRVVTRSEAPAPEAPKAAPKAAPAPKAKAPEAPAAEAPKAAAAEAPAAEAPAAEAPAAEAAAAEAPAAEAIPAETDVKADSAEG